MNLKEQLYVCTLARAGTISRAAEELFISPPALSIYLSNLEKYLGVRLFERTGKSLKLTALGEEYVKRAEKMLQMKAEFDLLVEQTSGNCRGNLRIGIQHRRAIKLVSALTSRFLSEYPSVNLTFKEGIYSGLIKMYQTREVDFLVCNYCDELAGEECVELGREAVLAAIPKDHPVNGQLVWKEGEKYPRLDLRSLDQEVFILPPKDHSLRITADKILEEYGIRPGRIIEISYFETVVSMIGQGIGVGFNRAGYLSMMDRFQNVQYCYIGEEPYYTRLVLAYRKGKNLPPHEERLIELLKEHVKEHIEEYVEEHIEEHIEEQG